MYGGQGRLAGVGVLCLIALTVGEPQAPGPRFGGLPSSPVRFAGASRNAGRASRTPRQSISWYGRVVAQSTLEPVAAARVAIVERATATVEAAEDGRFAIDVPPGDRLWVSAPGFLDGFVELRAGRDPDLGRLVLRHETSLSGRILRGGEPAAGITVIVPPDGAHGNPPATAPQTVTDEAGSFRIGGLRSEQLEELIIIGPRTARTIDLGSALRPFDPRHYELGNIFLAPVSPLAGRVLDADGQPVAGAIVSVRSSSSVRLPGRNSDVAVQGRIRRPEGITDESGAFELPLPAGEHLLMAFSPTSGVGSTIVVSSPTEETAAEIRIGLGGTASRGGRVTDLAGAPLSGAQLSVRLIERWSLGANDPALPGIYTTRSDARGCFTFDGLPAGDTVWLDAGMPGFVTRRARLGPAAQFGAPASGDCGDIGDIRLGPAARIAGTVVDDAGRPVAGASLSARRYQDVGGYLVMGRAPTISDADGRFVIDALLPGDYALSARAVGHADTTLEDLELGAIASPDGGQTAPEAGSIMPGPVAGSGQDSGDPAALTTRVVLRRIRNVSDLEVLVLDPRGAPEPDAEVRAELRSGVGVPQTPGPSPRFTGADGRAVFADVPLGGYSLAASAEGRRDNSGWQGPHTLEPGAPPAIISTNPTPPFASLSGRLVDRQGHGIARAIIEARGNARGWDESRALTQADGSFRFDRLPVGRHALKATVPGLVEFLHDQPVAVAPPGIDDILLQLPPVGTITGRVVGARGGELDQLSVGASASVRFDDELEQSTNIWARPAPPSSDGRFHIDNVPPGTWRVYARANEGREASTEVVVTGEDPPVDVQIVLAEGYRLAGRLTWRDGGGAPAWLSIHGTATPDRRYLEVGEDGEFEVLDLAPDTYDILVSGAGLRAPFFQLVEVSADTEVEIPVRGAAVSGRVLDAETGLPVPGVSVRTDPIPQRTSDMHDQFRSTDRNGAFTAGPFPLGPWRFEFSAPGYARREPMIEIGEENLDDFRIELQPTPGLRVRFETPDGRAPRSINMVWLDIAHGEGMSYFGLPAGGDTLEFHYGDVALGRGVLYASSGNDRLAARRVITNDGEPVVVRLRGAGRLYVEVAGLAADEAAVMTLLDEEGLPVTTSSGGLEWATRTRPEGAFRAFTLPAGTYDIVVTAVDGRTWSGKAEIRPFEDTDVVLR